MTSFFSTQTQVALVDTRVNAGTIQLPATTTFAYRNLIIKDIYGTFATKTLTLTTQGSDTFEDGATTKILSANAGFIQLYAGQAGKWFILSGTDLLEFQVSSLQFSTLSGPLPQISTVALFTSNTSNYFQNALQNWSTSLSTVALFTSNTSNYFQNTLLDWSTPVSTAALFTSNTSNYYFNLLLYDISTTFESTTRGLGTASYISSASLQSTVTNLLTNTGITQANLNSTIIGLGTFQYISSLSLQSTVTNLLINTGITQATLTSTIIGLGTFQYISSSQLLSTTAGFTTSFRSLSVQISTLVTSNLTTSNALISSLIVNSLQFGDGTGWADFGPIRTVALSTIQINVDTIYANQVSSSTFIGDGSQLINLPAISSATLFSTVRGLGQIYLSSISQATAFTSNTSNFYSNLLQNYSTMFSTAVSTVALFTSNTSNYFQNTLQNWSTGLSTVALFTSNTSNYYLNLLQNWSTADSTIALFTSNTSNYFLTNAGGPGVSSLLGVVSSGLSTVALFTSNTSNFYSNLLQNYSTMFSTGLSSVALFTSNTSNFYNNLLQNFSTPLSTVALFTSNTSNYYINLLQNWSTPISTVAAFTSNTSNFARNILQDWSTQQTTIFQFTSNTSNYYSSIFLFDVSTSILSTTAGLGTAGYISSSQLISSVSSLLSQAGGASQTAVTSSLIGLGTFGYVSTLSLQSTVAQLLLATSGVTQETLNSTLIGLGTFQYISSLSLQSTVTSLLATTGGVSEQNLTSSLVGLGTLGYISSINLRSTFFINSDNAITIPSYDIYFISTGYQYSSASWGNELAPLQLSKTSYGQFAFSSANTYLSYTGSNSQDFRITYTCGGNDGTAATARPTLTLEIYDPLSGTTTYQTLNTNEVAGTSVSLVKTLSSSNVLSFTVRGLSNYTFLNIDESLYQITIESIQPLTLDTFSSIRISSLSLYDPSTFSYRAITISAGSIYVDGNLAGASGSGASALTAIPSTLSTFAILASSLQVSTIQADTITASSLTLSSLTLLTGNVSSLIVSSLVGISGQFSTLNVSSLIAFSQNVSSLNVSTLSSFFTNTSTLTTTQINFGSGFGYLIMPDIQPNSVYTSTVTTSNIFIGFNSNQSFAGFFGTGTYVNSVIFESNIGGANQELAFFRGASATDRIRFQTTGYIVFEPGVASRTFPSVGSNATPALVITTASNVGIQNFAPSFPLDVTGTIRATTSLSTFLVQTSNLQATTVSASNVSTISSFAATQITSNNFFVQGSTFLQRGVSTSFLLAGPDEIRLNTSNTARMYINTAGSIGIGLTNPGYQVHITSNLYASSMLASSIFASSITSYLTLSSVQTYTSSLLGNTFEATNTNASNSYASTFTGRWNDAIYLTLQEI